MFAAMDVASGVTISNCYRRHRHQEFLRFLNDIDANLPRAFDVHLVVDNYGTHKAAKVRAWLIGVSSDNSSAALSPSPSLASA